MRNHDNAQFHSPSNRPGLSTVTAHRPGVAAYPVAPRAPATYYQAPRRDFFHETSTNPDYRRQGLPRYVAEYGGGYPGHRPYVSKFTVPPRY